MMQQMRENTKWIMLITAAAFVALMVFEWGMDMSGQSAGALTGGRLGSVNGSAITYGEYTQVYRNLYEQRQQSGARISASENREIEQEAFEQLITDRLIEQELARRGIVVTDEEVRQAARYAPPPEFRNNELFLTDGQFDLEKYHQFLASPAVDRQLLMDLERYYRRVIPRNKLFQQVSAATVVPDSELWRLYRERHETASMEYVRLDPRLIQDAEVTVQERDVAAYYNEHREDFQRPARAEVRVVAVDKRAAAADTAASLERAREVRAELVEGGADFAEVASRESADEGTATVGGSLGTVERGQMVPAFEEAVWSVPVGQVSEPVLTRFGYHLIRVDSRTEETAEVSHILLPVQRTLESEDRMLAQVDSLEDMVDRMTLEAAAEDLGLQVRPTSLTPSIPNMPGVGSVEEGLDWIFEQDAIVGEVSPIFENERSYYLMELEEREPARSLTLEEARPTIETILRNEQKRERTRERGRALVDRIESGATLAEAPTELQLPVRQASEFTRLDFIPGVGAGNAAIGAAFGLEIGETSGLLETPDAFFVIQVTDRGPADREAWEAQLEQQRQQTVNAFQNQRLNRFLEALREEADVVDQRDEVLQANGRTT